MIRWLMNSTLVVHNFTLLFCYSFEPTVSALLVIRLELSRSLGSHYKLHIVKKIKVHSARTFISVAKSLTRHATTNLHQRAWPMIQQSIPTNGEFLEQGRLIKLPLQQLNERSMTHHTIGPTAPWRSWIGPWFNRASQGSELRLPLGQSVCCGIVWNSMITNAPRKICCGIALPGISL